MGCRSVCLVLGCFLGLVISICWFWVGIVLVFRWWVRFGRVGCFVFVGCVDASSTDLCFAGGLLGIAWLYFFRFGIAFWVWLALRLV